MNYVHVISLFAASPYRAVKEVTMKPFNPHIGYHRFHDEVNMNYQLNRSLSFGALTVEEVEGVAQKIKDLADWKREFLRLAETADREGNITSALSFYRLAEFFMTAGDPDKERAYDRFIELFHEEMKDDYAAGLILEDLVPYDGSYLRSMRLPVVNGKKKGHLVVTMGFDCFMEEVYSIMNYFRESGYEVIGFEGPGQGGCIRKHGLVMIPEWEKPVGAVFDHYGLANAALLGISLGGYLAPRAAAYERRIDGVIAFDIIYDFFECAARSRGPVFEFAVRTLLALRLTPVLNFIIRARMRRDPYTAWGVHQGFHVFGVSKPCDFLTNTMKYTTRNISHLITQDVLLLAGTQDHFIPLKMFYRQARALTNVRSLTCRLFTEAQSAQSHCQVGNVELALSFIVSWMDELKKTGPKRYNNASRNSVNP
jgi:pimeloyl-ACP methyl ester carboxylesterase